MPKPAAVAKPAKPAKKAATRKLPPALVRNAEREAEQHLARVRAQAEADVALVLRRRAQAAETFYDMGEALDRLTQPAALQALGVGTFGELCEKRLDMSPTKGAQLVAIVRRLRREDAVRWGPDRAEALLDLADATPEEDTPAELEHATRQLPSGKTLDVAKASARQLREAAKELRAARVADKPRRGRTVSSEERSMAAACEAALRSAGHAGAKVTAVATKPGQPAHVRIEGLPFAALKKLGGVLAKALREG